MGQSLFNEMFVGLMGVKKRISCRSCKDDLFTVGGFMDAYIYVEVIRMTCLLYFKNNGRRSLRLLVYAAFSC